MAHYLFNWDSAQFALALEVFEIPFHQPHPPGYFLYVSLANFFNLFINNANLAYIFENILFFVLSVFIFYRLAVLIFKNKRKALISGLFLIFNPVIWFYGEITAVYVVDLFFSLLFVFLAWQIVVKECKINNKLFLFSFFLGLAGGFRQTLLIFFFPLWLLSAIFFFYRETDKRVFFKDLFKNFLFFILGCFLWLVPTVILTGGFLKYLDLIQSQFGNAGKTTSIFQQAQWHQVIIQIKRVIKSLLLLMNFSILLIPFSAARLFYKKIWQGRLFLKQTLLVMVWFIPSLFVFSLMHFAQVGYLFTLAGGILLWLGGMYYEFLRLLKFKVFKILFILLFMASQCFIFLSGWQALRPRNNLFWQRLYDKLVDTSISPHQLDWLGIKRNDEKISQLVDVVNKFDPNSTIVLTEFGNLYYFHSHENWASNFRILSYYLPDYEVYEIFWGKEKKYFKTIKHQLSKKYATDKIILGANIKTVIFINHIPKMLAEDDSLMLEGDFPPGVFVLDTKKIKEIEYVGYHFILKKNISNHFMDLVKLKWDWSQLKFLKDD